MYRVGSNKRCLASARAQSFIGFMALLVICLQSGFTLAQSAAPDKSQEALKVALGGSSAMTAFSACGYIGTMADAYRAGIYKENQLAVRMGGLIGGLKMNKGQLDQLAQDKNLGAEDQKMLSNLVEILEELITEAQSLRQYAGDKKPQHLKAFHDARTKSWQMTAKLLGLNKEFAEKLAPGGAKLGK
jgi:hypothetical protein